MHNRDKPQIPVTVVVMTRNEAHNIEACLQSVRGFSEVIVIDSHSDDGTAQIAEEMGARVVQFSWDGKYPKKKEWSLRNAGAEHDWILFLDADERVPFDLAEEIRKFVDSQPSEKAMAVAYDYVFLGRVLKHGFRPQKVVFLNRGYCKFPEVDESVAPHMWEVEGHYQPIVDGDVGLFQARMLHRDADDLYALFARHNRYSDWEAAIDTAEFRGEGASSWIRRRLKRVWGRVPMRGMVAFVHSYIFKLGFLDGLAGFHFAMFRAFYYWQIALKRYDRRGSGRSNQ